MIKETPNYFKSDIKFNEILELSMEWKIEERFIDSLPPEFLTSDNKLIRHINGILHNENGYPCYESDKIKIYTNRDGYKILDMITTNKDNDTFSSIEVRDYTPINVEDWRDYVDFVFYKYKIPDDEINSIFNSLNKNNYNKILDKFELYDIGVLHCNEKFDKEYLNEIKFESNTREF